ncbi:MAG TPA: SulP family inorganic anion transporter, partial [Rhizomicrobium sp.]
MNILTKPVTETSPVNWQNELTAGVTAAVLGLPMCLAAGVLVLAPLGPDYIAVGAAAGLFGFIVAGALSALVATSSFVITVPRASQSLVLATLVSALLADASFAGQPVLIVATAALCVFLSGLWQILFGIFRVARVIKFTPHPVFAGFANGAALLIMKAQIQPFFVEGAATHLVPAHPAMLVLVIGLALIAVYHERVVELTGLPAWIGRIPGAIVAFAFGIAAYYAIKGFSPETDIGAVIGQPDITLTSPLLLLTDAGNAAHVLSVAGNVVLVSLVLAIVASMETLMSLRSAQNITDLEVHPVRELAAQGVGNCAAALLAPISSAASPALQAAAYRAGGRTRFSGLATAVVILIVG